MQSTHQNLFITRLPRSYTDLDLAALFKAFKPRSAKIMVDPATGRSKGFGFIYFETEKGGKAAFDAMNGTRHDCAERVFTVIMQPSNHDGRIASAESRAIYIRNIPIAATKDDVEALIQPFGTITNFSMRQDLHGGAVWVVYVEYETIASAKNAMHALHQKWTRFPGPAPVIAKFSDTEELKSERHKHREAMGRSSSELLSSQTSVQPEPPPTIGPPRPFSGSGDGANILSANTSQVLFDDDVTNVSLRSAAAGANEILSRPRSPIVKMYTHNPYAGQCFAT